MVFKTISLNHSDTSPINENKDLGGEGGIRTLARSYLLLAI
jgi:hypothetical protein